MTSLESAGTLTLNGSAVTLNQVISKADIDSGLLTFAPATDANGTGYDSFDFEVHDGTEYSASSYSMTVDVTLRRRTRRRLETRPSRLSRTLPTPSRPRTSTSLMSMVTR